MDRITAATVFVCIVDRGSLTAAADYLDMSRSMVTRYLAALEDWAGARLLHRSTRRISLTPAGEQVLAHCQTLLGVADDLSAVSDTDDAPLRGSLRISCSLSLGQDVLVPVFQAFLLQYPEVTLDLHIGNQAVNLVEERIDLAIRITNELDPNLIARKLGECRSVLCASPDYLEAVGSPSRIDDLSHLNCLIYSHFDKSVWAFNHKSGSVTVPVSGNLSANDPSVLLSAALDGLGVSLQPYYATVRHIDRGELVPLLPDYEPELLGIYGVYSSRRHMPRALRAMIDMLVEKLSQFKH